MASPIAAGSVVVPLAAIQASVEAHAVLKFGICESAVAPVNPGDPPTNVVVDWSDGTSVTYPVALGLLQVQGPTGDSILGSVVAYNQAVVMGGLPNPGSRVRGPVVFDGNVFQANGDPFLAFGPSNEWVVFLTKIGYVAIPRSVVSVLPAA
jgi:phage baseplate assembly protein gpV